MQFVNTVCILDITGFHSESLLGHGFGCICQHRPEPQLVTIKQV